MNAPDPMYTRHRERLLERLRAEGMAAVVFTNTPKTRNHDCEYRFRPDSDFWWLTGFKEPGGVLLLLPGREEGEQVFFCRPRVQSEEIWTGLRMGTERAPCLLNIDEAHPLQELWDMLPELLKGYESILYRTGADEDRDRRMIGVATQLRNGARGGVVAPSEWIDPVGLLHELRLLKSDEELVVMRKAAAVACEAHTAAMAAAEPGKSESQIDGLIVGRFLSAGGAEAYNNIVAGGGNACILHYNENDAPLADGDLLLIDAGCELACYASDITRTFPVNGTFSPEQRAIYELVLKAEKAAIAIAKPGVLYTDLHDTALSVLCEGLSELGLLPGSPEEIRESSSYVRFFMHKTGHWMGLDVHDCGVYFVEGESRPLEPGMVFTVEPGLYIAPDDETVEERWRGIGVRIEDDILITADGHENLTAAAPKEVEDVEAACRGAQLQTSRA